MDHATSFFLQNISEKGQFVKARKTGGGERRAIIRSNTKN
jgi:hypothetical protein